MSRIRFTLALLACILLSTGSQAQSPTPAPAPAAQPAADDAFKDWQSVMDNLSALGINAIAINWQPITTMCQGLKLSANDRAYNKCSFEKARDMTLFTKDKAQCDLQVQGLLPDSLLKGRTDTLTETDKGGQAHTFQRTTAPLTKQDLDQQRAGAFAGCMQKIGWVDSGDWKLGKRDAYCH